MGNAGSSPNGGAYGEKGQAERAACWVQADVRTNEAFRDKMQNLKINEELTFFPNLPPAGSILMQLLRTYGAIVRSCMSFAEGSQRCIWVTQP